MITIEKRTVTIDKDEFISELKRLAKLYAHGRIGLIMKDLNAEFRCKMTHGDYVELCNTIGISLYRGKVILFKDLEKIN